MTRQYSIRTFLRQAPNDLIEQYLISRNIPHGVDFSALKPMQIDPLFDVVTGIEDAAVHAQVDRDFQAIFLLSFEGGIKTILDTGRFAEIDLQPVFEKMKGHYAKAFYTFLNHYDLFLRAHKLARVEYLPTRYWRKVLNLKPLFPPDYAGKCNDLKAAIIEYFCKTEGRGRACHIDYYQQDNLRFYFCYPEDYSKTDTQWEDGEFKPHYYNPSFEVIFVYDTAACSLDSFFFQSSIKVDKKLKELFAKALLGLDKLPEREDVTYNLEALKAANFQFNIPENSKIAKVLVQAVRFSLPERKITVQEDTPKASVPELLASLAKGNGQLSLQSAHISQVTLQAFIQQDSQQKPKKRTFTISWPASCSLKYDEEDDLLRQMIIDSGLEAPAENYTGCMRQKDEGAAGTAA